MTAVARGLSEHPLPDLVMAGCACDPHVTHALAALGSLPGSHAVASHGLAKQCRQQEARGAASRGSLVILNCLRSRKYSEIRVTGRWRPRGRRAATRWRVVRDLPRLLRVFAVLRDGCGWCCPGFGGC